jgi:D-tyrosyl-tRNA(Tyr) deacylase
MRAIIQRVSSAHVIVDAVMTGSIRVGLLILLGIEDEDQEEDIHWLGDKIKALRIFNDDNGKMNLSLQEVNGELMVISQFTLYASTKKGNRPSFIKAARPEKAIPLYEAFLDYLTLQTGQEIKTGQFGADMKVHLINDGPVTIIIDSKQRE